MFDLVSVQTFIAAVVGTARRVIGSPRRAISVGLSCMLAASGLVLYLLVASLPTLDGTIPIAALDSPVKVATDGHGIPSIRARGRNDGLRALGFVHARDRLFQMDLMRRRSAGRLAEVFGASKLEDDKWHKVMGFEHIADAILAQLPNDQREALRAYAQGVNGAMAKMGILPWEFLVLRYRPEPWEAKDSLLVILGLYERLSWSGANERAATVIEKAFSAPAAEFFFPERDCYTESLFGSSIAECRLGPVPDGLRSPEAHMGRTPFVPNGDRPGKGGSNAWAIGPTKSRDGRAILANDMHLDLLVPNIWYRADFVYEHRALNGLTLPGLPLVLSGSNGRVAWGFTNVSGDFSDLVLLDADAGDEKNYIAPEGPRRFDERSEVIRVRDGSQITITVRDTIWGPVLPETLLGKRVAVRWTALDPSATDLKLLDIDEVATVTEALDLMNHSGGPALNALVTDNEGNIGWTYTGRFPVRVGFSGLTAKSWSDGTRDWRGYISPAELPRVVNPDTGYIVSANQRMTGKTYPYAIAPYFDGGYRAYRIAQRLDEMHGVTERDMLHLQLDTEAEIYRYYQNVALAALTGASKRNDGAFRDALRRHIAAWDGKAEPNSLGLGVLVEFQKLMADAIFKPLLEHCRAIDPHFDWTFYRETSLRRALTSRPIELLPNGYSDWDDFIAATAEKAAHRVMARVRTDKLEDLIWARINVVQIRHPLSGALDWFSNRLDMPAASLPGCDECIRWSGEGGGATERLVVSAGHERDGIFHMPAGQSGHFLSAFYRDQQQDWIRGSATPLAAGEPEHQLTLEP